MFQARPGFHPGYTLLVGYHLVCFVTTYSYTVLHSTPLTRYTHTVSLRPPGQLEWDMRICSYDDYMGIGENLTTPIIGIDLILLFNNFRKEIQTAMVHTYVNYTVICLV